MRRVRRLRLLEYVGTQEWVDSQIEKRNVKGRVSLADGSITEAFLGETNEILNQSATDNIADE